MAQETKNAIRRAFIRLLNERPIDKISIKDIAETGAVNRNTFYYYYADIYALVEDIFEMEAADFLTKMRRYESCFWTPRTLPCKISGRCFTFIIPPIRAHCGAITTRSF